MAKRKIRVMVAKPGLDGHDVVQGYWPGAFVMRVMK